MKIITALSIFLTLTLYINAAPSEASTEHFVTEDDIARSTLKSLYKKLEAVVSDPIGNALVKSIDQECMIRKYKEHKIVDELLSEDALLSESSDVDAKLVIVNIGLSCSDKLKPVLGFVFDTVFSFSDLYEAFHDDENFKEYTDDFTCYNNYAVRHNYIDPSSYPDVDYKLVGNQTEKECDEEVQELKEMLNLYMDIARYDDAITINDLSCLKHELTALAEKILFKYLLLVPTTISGEQKLHEKENFVNDFVVALDRLMVCSTKKEEKIIETNEI